MKIHSCASALLFSGAIAFVPLAHSQVTDASASGSAPALSTPPTAVQASDAPVSAEVIPVPAAEASPQNAKGEPRTGSSAQQLEEVTVTATKREKSARDIPGSVSAIRGVDLEKQGARNVKDYLMEVPGISLQENQNGEAGGRSFTVRGVGAFSNGNSQTFGAQAGGNQAVGQFIGDVPMTDPVGNKFTPDLDPFDLKSVEVLKGPQGTAFGGTALNGAIRYVPNAPELDTWSAKAFAEGNEIHEGGTGSVFGLAGNAPIGDSLALRASGIFQSGAGVYDNLLRKVPDADSSHKWSARGQALWRPFDPLSINLMYLKQHTHTNDLLYADNPDTYTNDGKPGPSTGDTQFSLADIDARYSFGSWGTVVYQGAHQTKDSVLDQDDEIVYAIAQQNVQLTRIYAANDIRGDTHELRWVSANGGNWNWIIGAFYMDYRLTGQQNLLVANTGALGPLLSPLLSYDNLFTPQGVNVFGTDTTEQAKEKSIYGELSRKLFSDWEVTVGARRYDTKLGANVVATGAAASLAPTGLISGGTTTAPVAQAQQGLDPKASISWKPSHNFMVYAAIARGFQFGGTNPSSIFSFDNPVQATWPDQYQSSSLWNHEIGVRTDWLYRTLRFDLTLYDIDWKNAQITQDTSQGHVLGGTFTENVGKVRSQGAEALLSWLTPLPGLKFTLNSGYSYARTAVELDSSGSTYAAGTLLPSAPRLQASTTLAYNTSLGPWAGNASVIYSYVGKAFNNLDHQFVIDGFGLLNLNLSVARPDWISAPALTFGITNVLNERGIVGEFSGGPAGGATGGANQALLGSGWNFTRPRTMSIRLTADY